MSLYIKKKVNVAFKIIRFLLWKEVISDTAGGIMLVHLVPFTDLEEQVTQLSVKGMDEKSAQRPGSNGLIA